LIFYLCRETEKSSALKSEEINKNTGNMKLMDDDETFNTISSTAVIGNYNHAGIINIETSSESSYQDIKS
jgi:hypothetical protein